MGTSAYSADNPFAQGYSPDNPFAQQRRAGDKPRGFRTPEQIARENAADTANAKDVADADTYGNRLGSMAERAASVLPGGSAALTGARYLTKKVIGEPETWEESAQANARGAEEGGQNAPGVNIPVIGGRVTLADAPTAALGFRQLLRAVPTLGNVLGAGIYGGAVRAADPRSESGWSRAGNTAMASAASMVLPALAKAGEVAGLRIGANKTPSFDELQTAQEGSRAAAAEPKYQAFRDLGDLGKTPKLSEIENLPVVQRALAAVQGESPTLNRLPATDARVLDAVFKRLSDKAWTAKHGFETGEATRALQAAMDEAAAPRGGSYSAATEAYRIPSQEMGMRTRGFRTMQYAAAPKGAPPAEALGNSPAQFPGAMADATAAERNAAAEGVMARLGVEPTISRVLKVVPMPSRAMNAAPALLEQAGAPTWLTQARNSLTDRGGRQNVAAQNLLDALRQRFGVGGQP